MKKTNLFFAVFACVLAHGLRASDTPSQAENFLDAEVKRISKNNLLIRYSWNQEQITSFCKSPEDIFFRQEMEEKKPVFKGEKVFADGSAVVLIDFSFVGFNAQIYAPRLRVLAEKYRQEASTKRSDIGSMQGDFLNRANSTKKNS